MCLTVCMHSTKLFCSHLPYKSISSPSWNLKNIFSRTGKVTEFRKMTLGHGKYEILPFCSALCGSFSFKLSYQNRKS